MHAYRRAIAAAVAIGIAAATLTPASAYPMRAFGRRPQSVSGPVVATPHVIGVRDLGRRNPAALTRVSLLLNYRHQRELDMLVQNQGNRRSPLFHHFLTRRQFDNFFAPTMAQEMQVIRALRNSGFRITHLFPNRTIVDAIAPTRAVENFFGTEIHSVVQFRRGRSLGVHYTNVRPVTVPAGIARFVKTVSVNDLIVAHTPHLLSHYRVPMHVALNARGRRHVARHIRVPHRRFVRHAIHRMTANVITNPGFETGRINDGWFQCGNVNAFVVTTHPHSGKYDNLDGKQTSGEPYGDSGVCQLVTIPTNGLLSAWLYQTSNEVNTDYAWQEADLLDQYGNVVSNLYTTVNNVNGWVQGTWDLSAYAGGQYYLYFGVHGDGYGALTTRQYVDDVSLASAGSPTPTPAPTATPTVAPTATPTAKPTATPTAKPTATPTAKPTATPTAKPTATPTVAPTATPTAAPGGCNNAAADNGPLSGSNGWLATGVAKAFDFPVQHGCNGAGVTVGVIIDSPVQQSDINAYLSAAGVTETGTITNVAVDGGGTYSSSQSSDSVEASLDVETIVGLAPGVNVRVYNFPSLSDQDIEDAYNQAVSDGVAATNSSFGGCETSDTPFDTATNSIAEQAASEGTTFNASSGDSGSNECGTGSAAVSAPASDTYFVGVGSVNFTDTSTGALASITAGTDSGNGFASGGGVSVEFPLPSYQSGVAGVITSGRNSPDVALPGVGVVVYNSGALEVDGTSWSCPQFTALIAEASELHGTKFGYVLPQIYSIFGGNYTNYTDVTSGSNGAYSAKAGYDQVTGIGAPKGWAWAQAI